VVIVSGPREASGVSGEDAQKIIDAYHQEQLRTLLEQVRRGLARLDAGEVDEFELDYLIHRYKRAAKQLWMFCGSSGAQSRQAAAALAYMRERGEERDWWGEAARPRDDL
jgi:hypothetical protein